MLTPQQRYSQAVRKARIQGARSMRRMMEGTGEYAECVMDLERDALIKEIGRAFEAGRLAALTSANGANRSEIKGAVAMSQRTIVEINHDMPGMASGEMRARFYELLMIAVGSGSDESWEPLKRFGFTKITQCHHSEDRKVVVADREYPFG